MAESILWATLIIASASLVFAFIAFRQVMKTSSSVDGFIQRADKFLAHFKAQAKGMFSPEFVGDTIKHTILSDIQNKDGSPVTMNQYVQETMNGYVTAYGPALKAEFKTMVPDIISQALNPHNPPPPGPGGPQNPGQALAQQRWGSGGLKAASKVAKASKKVPFAEKIGEYVEGAQAVVQLGGALKELKEEVAATFKGGGNGDESTPSTASDQGQPAWGPPF